MRAKGLGWVPQPDQARPRLNRHYQQPPLCFQQHAASRVQLVHRGVESIGKMPDRSIIGPDAAGAKPAL